VLRRVPDLTKQRELLGFTPQIGLEEGHRRLWDWYWKHAEREESVRA
jgi:nucleoside-diphosphate-sugar epimerase